MLKVEAPHHSTAHAPPQNDWDLVTFAGRPELRAGPAGPLLDDRALRHRVREEMRGSPVLALDHVTIEVEERVVTVNGRVPNHAHLRRLVHEAHEAGALRVRSLLSVGSDAPYAPLTDTKEGP